MPINEDYYYERARILRNLSDNVMEHTRLMENKVREIKTALAAIQHEEPITSSSVPSSVSETDYCICGQSSYGDMIACDNPECILEWFHFECVGLEEKPKGKWLCPICELGAANQPDFTNHQPDSADSEPDDAQSF